MKVVVTGATGMIGPGFVAELRSRGDTVLALVRNVERARPKLPEIELVAADLEAPGPWCETLAGADALVHLAGEPVGGIRWNARTKQRMRDSRVETTRTLVEAIAKLPAVKRPKALICASGVDYYPFAIPGLGDEDEVTEIDPPTDSFLGRVCRDWEKEANAASALGVRVACLRLGLVIGPGLAMRRLTAPFRWFVGGRIGSGKQWVSWIGLSDACGVIATATHDERYRGPINLVTDSTRNRDFARAVGHALHRPSWLPAPGFVIKIAAGEFAAHVLQGRRVVPAKLKELGYTWRQPELAEALRTAVSTT